MLDKHYMVTCKLVERSCNFRGLNLMFFINFGHISVRDKLPQWAITIKVPVYYTNVMVQQVNAPCQGKKPLCTAADHWFVSWRQVTHQSTDYRLL